MQGREEVVNSFVVEYIIHYILTRLGFLVPTLCVGMQCQTLQRRCDAERRWMHSHAERGNEKEEAGGIYLPSFTRVQSRVMTRAKLIGWSGMA